MRPHRPAKPGQIQAQTVSNRRSGGGGGGLGAAIAGYPDVNNGLQANSNTEGPDQGSGEGTIGTPSPVVAKPSFLQSWLNPALGQGYANYLYNVNPNNQAAQQQTETEGKNRLAVTDLENTGRMDVTKQVGLNAINLANTASDNNLKELATQHTLKMADQFGIDSKNLPDYQASTYNLLKQAAQANAGTQANIAGVQQKVTGENPYINSQRIGMNAQAQLAAGQLARDTRQEVGPGQVSSQFYNLGSQPLITAGPNSTSNTSSIQTKGPASAQYPGGIPMGGSSTTTGQQFGNTTTPNPGISQEQLNDIMTKFEQQGTDTPSASGVNPPPMDNPYPDNDGAAPAAINPVQTKPGIQQGGGTPADAIQQWLSKLLNNNTPVLPQIFH